MKERLTRLVLASVLAGLAVMVPAPWVDRACLTLAAAWNMAKAVVPR